MNKKQHFLPAGFLKAFSAHPEAGRDARVFVFDGEIAFENSVGNLCVETDYYSPDRQREFAIHGEMEPALFKVIGRLTAGDRDARSLEAMFYQASYLQVRGPEFENGSARERLDAAQKHAVTHYCQHLLQMEKSVLEKMSDEAVA